MRNRQVQRSGPPRGRAWLTAFIALACFAGLIAAALWLVLGPLANHEIGSGSAKLSAKDRLDELDSIRGLLLQAVGGAVVLGSLLVTARGMVFTGRTYRLTQQGHVTDRYSKAVEQLGSEQRSVRTGGIYALGRILKDSPEDQDTIVQVLTAFIREHATMPDDEQKAKLLAAQPTRRSRPPSDIAAALAVLRQRRHGMPEEPIDLAGAFLIGANLDGADLRKADLASADLRWSSLRGAQLQDAVLLRAQLRGADLTGARLDGALMTSASLPAAHLNRAVLASASLTCINEFESANLSDANLRGANLWSSSLEDAMLWRTDLTGTALANCDLSGADLSTVRGLTIEQLKNTRKDARTVLPAALEQADNEQRAARARVQASNAPAVESESTNEQEHNSPPA